MFVVLIILGVVTVGFVGTLIIAKKNIGQDKTVFNYMQKFGDPVTELRRMNEIQQWLTPLLETRVNGPDQSMRARHSFSPVRYVIKLDGNILASVWVQRGYTGNKTTSDLYLVEANKEQNQIISYKQASEILQ